MTKAIDFGWSGAVADHKSLVEHAPAVYPLQPMLLPVLVRFFSRFGQNERSLFSFLYSNDASAVRSFAEDRNAGDGFFGIHHLYDVARSSIGHRHIKDLDENPSSVSRMLGACALCLAGNLEDVREFASRGRHFPDRGVHRFANGACLDFLVNPSPEGEEQLLEVAGSNSYASINAHFVIAMTRIAAHDRARAVEHFEKCVDKTALGNFSYEMARALLLRMKADPKWPAWLTVSRGK